jgi:hypothetical protein
MLPARLRGPARAATLHEDPAAAVARVQAATR